MAWDLNVVPDSSHGIYGQVIVGNYLLTGNVKKVDGKFDRDKTDGGGLGTMVQRNLYGAAEGTFKCDGFLSTVQERQLAALKRRRTPFLACIAPKGLTAGAPADAMPACFGEYSKNFESKGEAGVSFELGAQGEFDEGTIMLAPDTLLTGESGVSIADDNTNYGGATSFGGALYAWLPAVTGGTGPTVTFKVTQSATLGGTYTDVVGGSTTAMAAGDPPQLVRIPSTSSVDAFTKIAWTAANMPTNFQPFVVFARRYNPAA